VNAGLDGELVSVDQRLGNGKGKVRALLIG